MMQAAITMQFVFAVLGALLVMAYWRLGYRLWAGVWVGLVLVNGFGLLSNTATLLARGG